MRKPVFLALSACLAFLLTACVRQEPVPDESLPARESVTLTVWGAEEDEALLEQIFASFQTHYAGKADFQINYQPQSESNCKDVLLGDLEGGADFESDGDLEGDTDSESEGDMEGSEDSGGSDTTEGGDGPATLHKIGVVGEPVGAADGGSVDEGQDSE